MLTMILQMTGATALYVVVTVILWHFWHKKTSHTLAEKLVVGLFYGLCSVASSHIGINFGDMVLNVRDLGPLAAGLFFDPVAGILSGLIGGIERYIIGEYFGIGAFTRVACGLSTCLAGFMAAVLYHWVYQGKRPSVVNCLLLGAETEVFHMYAVFITNRNNMKMASHVVNTCAVPMIVFTGIGLALCSLIIARMDGFTWKGYLTTKKKDTPIGIRFQRWLVAVIISLFAVSFAVNYSLQTRVSTESAKNNLQSRLSLYATSYRTDKNLDRLMAELDYSLQSATAYYVLVDTDLGIQYTCVWNVPDSTPASPHDLALMVSHADMQPFSATLSRWGDGTRFLCVCVRLDESRYLLGAEKEDTIYAERRSQMLETFFLEILIFTVLYLLIGILVNRLVVMNLDRVNASLSRITSGRLNEVVTVEESSELSQLSDDINRTVTALRGFIDAAEKRMEEDLKLAADIQDAALPKDFRLPSGNVELYALMDPAKQVGGDFYDFFYVGSDQLALVIADVSGKGIPASLFMMRAKTAIKGSALGSLSPAKLLESVNNAMCEGNEAKMFVTVWLGILDLKTGRMRCANAGHEYPVLMRAGGDYSLMKDKHGLVLGAYEDVPMHEYEIQLNPGDRLFVYTDGVPEAINENNEQYGTGRMTEHLNTLKDVPQEQVLASMREDIRRFVGDAEQFDDITMLGVTYAGPD